MPAGSDLWRVSVEDGGAALVVRLALPSDYLCMLGKAATAAKEGHGARCPESTLVGQVCSGMSEEYRGGPEGLYDHSRGGECTDGTSRYPDGGAVFVCL